MVSWWGYEVRISSQPIPPQHAMHAHTASHTQYRSTIARCAYTLNALAISSELDCYTSHAHLTECRSRTLLVIHYHIKVECRHKCFCPFTYVLSTTDVGVVEGVGG